MNDAEMKALMSDPAWSQIDRFVKLRWGARERGSEGGSEREASVKGRRTRICEWFCCEDRYSCATQTHTHTCLPPLSISLSPHSPPPSPPLSPSPPHPLSLSKGIEK